MLGTNRKKQQVGVFIHSTTNPSTLLEESPKPHSVCMSSMPYGEDHEGYPAYATAMPALPLEEDIKQRLPFSYAFLAKYPIPRILNEPDGCKLSNFNRTF